MAELRMLADKCEFGDYLTEALRDRQVCRLRSKAIWRRLLTETDLTLEKLTVLHTEWRYKQRTSELRGYSAVPFTEES